MHVDLKGHKGVNYYMVWSQVEQKTRRNGSRKSVVAFHAPKVGPELKHSARLQ